MAPSRCAAHERAYPCAQCTNALWSLLDAREPRTRLWRVDVGAFSDLLQRGLPDLSVCRCGAGSTATDALRATDRCACKGGKTTALRLAERRTDGGAAWCASEDVTPAPGALRLKGADRGWQQGCPHGASKESLSVLNLLKAKTQAQ